MNFSYDYDLTVFIGRFQPLTIAHLVIIREALRRGRRVMLVIGSANRSRDSHNLFHEEERALMIMACLTDKERERVTIVPVEDHESMISWTEKVNEAANKILVEADTIAPAKVALIGHKKDGTSFYLKEFPQWQNIDMPKVCSEHADHAENGVSATPIRNNYLLKGEIDTTHIPPQVVEYLKAFMLTAPYKEQRAEALFMEEYNRKANEGRPYPVQYVTVDNVVIHTGAVLLVQRKAYPGKNLWALPGGHLNLNERVRAGSLRELKEETQIDLPYSTLRASVKGDPVVFDDPYRSTRYRTITHATFYHLIPNVPTRERGESDKQYNARLVKAFSRPKIKASDDAKKAKWVMIDEIDPRTMMEDHWLIIKKMKNLAKE